MASRSESAIRLGRPYASEGVADRAAQDAKFAAFFYQCLRRHASGDWGNISLQDKPRNQRALDEGSRILSIYRRKGCPEIWIVTESDRSATRILFPQEYEGEPCRKASAPEGQPNGAASCAGEISQSKEDLTQSCRSRCR